MHYEQVGSGRPVVLLHGISNHCLAWAPQLDALAAAGWRAILPDLAGHGRSAAVTERTTTGDLAGDVIALLDVLEVPAAPVCGLSLGGMVASWKAIWLAPDGPRKRLEATWEGLTSEAYRQSPAGQAFYASWWRLLGGVSGQALAAVADGLLSFDVTAALARVQVPVLAVAGEHDRLAQPPMVRQVATAVPGARFEAVADAQHLVNLERPDRFNELLLGLLATTGA